MELVTHHNDNLKTEYVNITIKLEPRHKRMLEEIAERGYRLKIRGGLNHAIRLMIEDRFKELEK